MNACNNVIAGHAIREAGHAIREAGGMTVCECM